MKLLDQRVADLEVAVRRWKAVSICLIALVFVGYLVQAREPLGPTPDNSKMTVKELMVRETENGPAVHITADATRASILLTTPPSKKRGVGGDFMVVATTNEAFMLVSQGADAQPDPKMQWEDLAQNGVLLKVDETHTSIVAGKKKEGQLVFLSDGAAGGDQTLVVFDKEGKRMFKAP